MNEIKPVNMKENVNRQTVIYTEEIIEPERFKTKYRLFSKNEKIKIPAEVKKRSFIAVERIVGHFYTWLELPDMKQVPDILSFQLDAWKRYGIRE